MMAQPHIMLHRTLCFLVTGLLLAGCRSHLASNTSRTPQDPVLVIYHVKHGAEQELETLLAKMWETYEREGMVFPEPHVRLRAREDQDHDHFIEIFTWRGYYATEYPPESVKALWKQIEPLCEPRASQPPIEFHDAKILAPKIRDSVK